MKNLIAFYILLILFSSCTKPKIEKQTTTASEPTGFIDSLSHQQCKELPKPDKHD